MNKIRINLEFAGAVLPVGKDEQGRDVVPLKPIAEIFGLDWTTQYQKVNNGLKRRLGTCIGVMPYADQHREMVCIRLDRVAAYLNTINPERVRANGNEDGAAFLEQKQEEWDDLIHAYEMQNGMFALTEHKDAALKIRKTHAFLAICREKRATENAEDRKVLAQMMRSMASELGVPYQEEIAV